MAKAILNYTTTISTEKTASEIQHKLAMAGAQRIMSEYDTNKVLSAMSFQIQTHFGLLSFYMPANLEGVYKSLKANPKVPKKLKTTEQAARVAWRINKDWIEAQLARVEAGNAELAEVFLAYVQTPNGQTFYNTLKEKGFPLLGHKA